MRRWIAKKLYPEAFANEAKYRWLVSELTLDRRWLGEFTLIGIYLDRTLRNLGNHYRKLDEPAEPSPWHDEISRFREQLRTMTRATDDAA